MLTCTDGQEYGNDGKGERGKNQPDVGDGSQENTELVNASNPQKCLNCAQLTGAQRTEIVKPQRVDQFQDLLGDFELLTGLESNLQSE